MEETTQTTAIDQADTMNISLSEVQQQAFKVAQEELDKFDKELETKKYLVDLNKADVLILQNFISVDAKWKFMESLGIGEVIKNLAQSVDKNGKVFINAVALEAIYYYLSKVEGTGSKVDSESIGDVETYLKLLKAVNSARNGVSKDNEEKKRLEYILACRAEGLDPENPEIPDTSAAKE